MLRVVFAVVVAFLCSATLSEATPIVGARVIVAADGEVTARFEYEQAGYTSDLQLVLVGGGTQYLFSNHITPIGSETSLGWFTAGTELIFELYVRNTDQTYYTGEASRNPDGMAHATVDEIGSLTYVGFEDIYGGGDQDFDDLIFSFQNTRSSASPVPEASATLPLLGMAFGAMALLARKVKRS